MLPTFLTLILLALQPVCLLYTRAVMESAGGPLSWDIELGRAGAGGVSSVSVAGEVKPLPVIGAFVQAMGSAGEGGYVELKVDVSYRSRPEWLEGDYDSWIAAWD